MGRSGRERTVALPQHTLYGLHPRQSWTSCWVWSLPQHTSYGLHLPRRPHGGCAALFASAHFIWAAPVFHHVRNRIFDLCLSTLHMGCTRRSRPGHGHRLPLPQHTSYGLHPIEIVRVARKDLFASAHFIWAAPVSGWCWCSFRQLCLSTLHMGCTGKTAQRHGYSIVKCAVRG